LEFSGKRSRLELPTLTGHTTPRTMAAKFATMPERFIFLSLFLQIFPLGHLFLGQVLA
jgi:hypothetical protein